MLHLQEHHSKVFDVVIFVLFYITSVIFILQKRSYYITNETVNNYLKNTQNLENLKYDLLEHSGNILFDHFSDLDLHFLNINIKNLNTLYILLEDFKNFLGDDKMRIYVLYLNISINNKFESLKMFLSILNFSFSIISFSEI